MAELADLLGRLDAAAAEGSPSLDGVLDAARGLLDSLDPEAMERAATSLLSWDQQTPVPARRERCRLVSYAAIMHGSALLPVLPAVAAALVSRFDEADEQVAEELLRTVGNLARYALATHASGLSAESLLGLVGPFLEPALHGSNEAGQLGCRAAQRVLAEAPQEMLCPAVVLPVLHAALKLFSPQGGAQQPHALALLASAVQLVGDELPEVDVHFVMQHAVAAAQAADAPTRRGGTELLRVMAPLLTRRGAQPYVEQIIEWVSDELRLLPAEVLAQPALVELLAAYQLPPRQAQQQQPEQEEEEQQERATATTPTAAAAAVAGGTAAGSGTASGSGTAAAHASRLPAATATATVPVPAPASPGQQAPAPVSSCMSPTAFVAATQAVRAAEMTAQELVRSIEAARTTNEPLPDASPPQRAATAAAAAAAASAAAAGGAALQSPPLRAGLPPTCAPYGTDVPPPQRCSAVLDRATRSPPATQGYSGDSLPARVAPSCDGAELTRSLPSSASKSGAGGAARAGSNALRRQVRRDRANNRRAATEVQIFAQPPASRPPPTPTPPRHEKLPPPGSPHQAAAAMPAPTPGEQPAAASFCGQLVMPSGKAAAVRAAAAGAQQPPPQPPQPPPQQPQPQPQPPQPQLQRQPQPQPSDATANSVCGSSAAAASESDAILARLRPQFVGDLRFTHRAAEQHAAVPTVSATTWQVGAASAGPGGSGVGGVGGGGEQRDALAGLLAMRTREIEATHRERCQRASQGLMRAYQEQVAQLQAALLSDLTALGETSQRQMQQELDDFMRHGLPAIQSILAGGALPSSAPTPQPPAAPQQLAE